MKLEKASAPPLQENWEKHKAKLKARYPTLTESDLQFETGKKDEMFKRLQIKLGIPDECMDKM